MATAKKKTAAKKAPSKSKKAAPKPRTIPAKATKPKAEAKQPVAEPKSSKKAQLRILLERPEGATVEEMAKQSNWQNHTVRGFLSMLKKAGTNVTSERATDERRYRIGSDASKAEASA